jgi:hypothetical protein
MSEFIFLFRSDATQANEAMGTPERAQKALETWMQWVGSLEKAGHIANRGLPLDRSGAIVKRDQVVTDGPFVEGKDVVLGFMVVRARDLAEANTLAAGCPMVIGGGGSVEVRPVAAFAAKM